MTITLVLVIAMAVLFSCGVYLLLERSLTRMLLRSRDDQHLDEGSREAAREFRQALHHVVAGGGSEGVVRSGPTELWTDVWLALVAFAAERVGAREWASESPQTGLTLDAAWDAIAAR